MTHGSLYTIEIGDEEEYGAGIGYTYKNFIISVDTK